MTLLEVRQAAYGCVLAPVSLVLEELGHAAHACAGAPAASALAKMVCAMLRPSSGAVYVGAFDTRIQPVQVKRIAAFVPHDAIGPGFGSFEAYIEYRADLWGLDRAQTVVNAGAILESLRGVHEAFAYPLAGALAAQPRLLVLDRPQAAYAGAIARAAARCAVLSTHAGEDEARAFTVEAVNA
ncbi:MAG: hypothetical protein ABR508_00355 [Candidatus Baltobacteraceae bacterium]